MVKVIHGVGNALNMAVHILVVTMSFQYSELEGVWTPIMGSSNFIENFNSWIKLGPSHLVSNYKRKEFHFKLIGKNYKRSK